MPQTRINTRLFRILNLFCLNSVRWFIAFIDIIKHTHLFVKPAVIKGSIVRTNLSLRTKRMAIFCHVRIAIYHNTMLMYGKEASNRKQEIDRQHYTIPNQRPKDKHCGKI